MDRGGIKLVVGDPAIQDHAKLRHLKQRITGHLMCFGVCFDVFQLGAGFYVVLDQGDASNGEQGLGDIQ